MQEQVEGQGAEERGRRNAAITKSTQTPSLLHLDDGVDDEYGENTV